MVLAWFSDEEWKDVISNPINWSKSKLNLPGAFAKKRREKDQILDAFRNFVENNTRFISTWKDAQQADKWLSNDLTSLPDMRKLEVSYKPSISPFSVPI